MSNVVVAAQLRARARHLRTVSKMIADSPALTVHQWSSPETWVGPTPQSVHDSLLTMRRRLRDQHEALLVTAAALDRRANELHFDPPLPATIS